MGISVRIGTNCVRPYASRCKLFFQLIDYIRNPAVGTLEPTCEGAQERFKQAGGLKAGNRAVDFRRLFIDQRLVILNLRDVEWHLERMDKLRIQLDKRNDFSALIGAVAGGSIKEEAFNFTQEQGFYVIIHSGDAVDIAAAPEGFVPRK